MQMMAQEKPLIPTTAAAIIVVADTVALCCSSYGDLCALISDADSVAFNVSAR